MSYDARQVANWFVQRASRDGRALTIMSVLKLAYFAHGWHLEMYKTPLFSNDVEAWQHGPVVPEVYHSFRRQGVVVSDTLPSFQPEFDGVVQSLLEQIYTIYGGLTAFTMSSITHEAGGPWAVARSLGGWYADIPNDLIQSHFEKKRLEASLANK